jgi:predicted site-specific integrase-resolvase
MFILHRINNYLRSRPRYRTNVFQYLVTEKEHQSMINRAKLLNPIHDTTKVIYYRANNKVHQNEIQKKIKTLRKDYPHHTVIGDIDKRQDMTGEGLSYLLEQVFEKKITEVIFITPNQLTFSNYEFLEWLLGKFGCELICPNK